MKNTDELITFKKIQEITAEYFNIAPEEITPKTHFKNDLNADLLDMVELSFKYQNEFNMNMTNVDLEKIETIKDMQNYTMQNKKGDPWQELDKVLAKTQAARKLHDRNQP